MNDEFRKDEVLLKKSIKYNQIKLKNISKGEYDKYIKS